MNVLVSVLAIKRSLHLGTVKMLLDLQKDPRATVTIEFVQEAPVDSARNRIMERFLKGEYDWLLSVDDDTGCIQNPLDLCFLGKDIVFCPTPMIQNGKLLLNQKYKQQGPGLQEIDEGGTGCFVVSRKVVETLKPPYFAFEYENGICTVGEDIYFCRKAREHFPLYAHNAYPCHHFKTVDLLSSVLHP